MKPIATMMVLFKAVNGMGREVQSVQNSIKSVQASVAKAGQAMTAAFTVPLGLAGAGILRTGIQQSESFNAMAANVRGTREELEALGKEMAKFAGSSPLSVAEVFESGAELGKGGMNLEEVKSAYKQIGALAVAHRTSTTEAAKTVTQLMNLYGGDVNKISDTMSGAITSTAQSFEDFAYFVEHAAAPLRTMGATLDDMGAMNVALATFGIRGSRGGAQAKALMDVMFDSKTSEKLGIRQARQNGELLRPTEYLQEMANALQGMGEAQRRETIADLFGKIGVTGMAPLIEALQGGELGTKLAKNLTSYRDSYGKTMQMHNKMMEGLSGAFKKLSSSWDSLVRSLTTSSVGGIIVLTINALAAVVDAIASLPPYVLTIGLLLFTTIAGIGPASLVFITALKLFRETGREMAALGVWWRGGNLAQAASTSVIYGKRSQAAMSPAMFFAAQKANFMSQSGSGLTKSLKYTAAFVPGLLSSMATVLKPLVTILGKFAGVMGVVMFVIDVIASAVRTFLSAFEKTEGSSVYLTYLMTYFKALGIVIRGVAMMIGKILGGLAIAFNWLWNLVGGLIKAIPGGDQLGGLADSINKTYDKVAQGVSWDFSDVMNNEPEKAAKNVSGKLYGDSPSANRWGEDKKIVLETNNPKAVKSYSSVFELRQSYGVL